MINGLSWSLGLLSRKNLVESRSFSCKLTFKNAFSISVTTAYWCVRKLRRIAVKSLRIGGVDSRQSLRLGDSRAYRQLQSYTNRMGVVRESFLTPG